MVELLRICDGVHTLETSIRPALGFELPLRSTILSLDGGGLAIISPVAIDDALAKKVEALGKVEHLIAPNTMHHLFVTKAAARWPDAAVHIAPGLKAKRPNLRHSHLLGDALPKELVGIRIDGAPAVDETVFFHRASRTLVVTDLVFHVREPKGFFTPMILWMVGAYRCLGQSRAFRFATKDRQAAAASVQRVLSLDFQRLVMAHGEVLEHDAKPQLAEALAWMAGPIRHALPA